VKRPGFFLLFAGLVAIAVGGFVGCGTLFTFNGRHAVAEWDLAPGTPIEKSFGATRTARYTLAIQVVFDRGDVEQTIDGADPHAHLPLVATLVDGDGNTPVKAVGWLDPNEPPTVLFGRSVDPRMRGNAVPELAAERLVGPWRAPREETVKVNVDLGKDKDERGTRILAARAVLYDDANPTAMKAGFALAGAGVLAFVVGVVLSLRGVARRGGKRKREME